MRSQLLYLELKTGHQDDGPAWIGRPSLSKTGQTVYFNGRALRRIAGGGVKGNYRDVESGEELWVSGVKKDGADRHWAGSGKIKIDARVVDEYLVAVDRRRLDLSRFEVCRDVVETDIGKFHDMENEPL